MLLSRLGPAYFASPTNTVLTPRFGWAVVQRGNKVQRLLVARLVLQSYTTLIT